MKIIIIFIYFAVTLNLNAQGFNFDNYFDVVNRTLKIHKVSDTEFLLYGDKGGVVRSYDSGETWEQNFAATKSNILSLVNHKGLVIGVTANNELIISSDKGNHWDRKIIDINPTTLVANDDLLFATEGKSYVFLTSDLGDSWIKKNAIDMPIGDLQVLTDELFVSTSNYELYHSSDLGDSWYKVELPDGMNSNQAHTIQVDENQLYIRSNTSIYRINSDLSFDKIGNGGSFNKYIVSGDSLHYFEGNPNNRIFKYSNQRIVSDTILHQFNYHNPAFDPSTYILTDVSKTDNILLMTFFGKGIMRSVDYGKNWKVVSHFPLFEGISRYNYFDIHEWNFSSSFINLNSFNSGATFIPGFDITIDTSNSVEYISTIWSNYWITKDSIVYFLNKSYTNSRLKNYFVSGDRGYTLQSSTKDIYNKLLPITANEKKMYTYKSSDNTGGIGTKITIYRISNGFIIDSVNSIDSISGFPRITPIYFNNKTFLCYEKVLNSSGETKFVIDYTDDFKIISNLTSVNKIEKSSIYSGSIYGSEKGYIYFSFFKEKKFNSFKVNLNNGKIDEIPENRNMRFFVTQDNDYVDNEILSCHYEIIDIEADTVINMFRRIRLNILNNGDIVQDTITNDARGFHFFNLGETIIIAKDQSILRPIEKDRLTTVKVESKTEVIGIWPFYPSPNPAKEKVSVYFYTELSNNIRELEVELINITTGVAYPIENYEISFINNWEGTVEFEISKYPSGSYLINMKLGKYQKSSKLIIAR